VSGCPLAIVRQRPTAHPVDGGPEAEVAAATAAAAIVHSAE